VAQRRKNGRGQPEAVGGDGGGGRAEAGAGKPLRLQRFLARAGVTSRRKAEDLIRAGRVRVDGAVATIGMSADPSRQRVTLDGKAVRPVAPAWLALNKPIGYVVSRRDPEGRRTVFDLLPKLPGLTYVGRLDVMTSGLLLLTTDGAAAHRLTHPRFAVPRTYQLGAHGLDARAAEAALGRPVAIDGRPVRVTRHLVRSVSKGIEIEVTLAEGRQRIVRRLAEALGLKVEWLHRVSYGPVSLGRLPEGHCRSVSRQELAMIGRLDGPTSTAEDDGSRGG
jgi:23S rRNA pseudouridine2605 synthase